jgi:transcriptional regulator with XRE-family HTH domain
MDAAPGYQQAAPARGTVRDRRRELGAFLRSRRARLRPADVGLADWGVRRVPGLRREEVAQLANVGLTWYTWLEQGRQARPSASVLTAIADALRLDAHANMLHLGFTDPHWRTLIADWDQEAARHVAMYRAAMTVHLDDPAWTALPARLAQLSPDFARFWASSDVAGPERRLKRFRHPSAGPLTLHSTSLLMADDPMIRIVVLYPATAADAAKLERLARSGATRPGVDEAGGSALGSGRHQGQVRGRGAVGEQAGARADHQRED